MYIFKRIKNLLLMKSKDEKAKDGISEKNEAPIAGSYTKGMIDLLEYDIIKSTYDSTLLYIEDAQKLSIHLLCLTVKKQRKSCRDAK